MQRRTAPAAAPDRLRISDHEPASGPKMGPRQRLQRNLFEQVLTNVESEGWYGKVGGAVSSARLRRLLDEGLAHLVTGLEFEATPFASSDSGLVALLEAAGSETDRVLPVLRHIARRRIREALPQLRALLDNDDPEILLGVIAALGEMGDADAVSPLIDLISRRHRDLTIQVLPVLGEIGTVEARQYLETVATGHQAEQVRAVALEIIREYWGN